MCKEMLVYKLCNTNLQDNLQTHLLKLKFDTNFYLLRTDTI